MSWAEVASMTHCPQTTSVGRGGTESVGERSARLGLRAGGHAQGDAGRSSIRVEESTSEYEGAETLAGMGFAAHTVCPETALAAADKARKRRPEDCRVQVSAGVSSVVAA